MNRTHISIAVGIAALLLLGAGCAAWRPASAPAPATNTAVNPGSPEGVVSGVPEGKQRFYYDFSYGGAAKDGSGQLAGHSIQFEYPKEWKNLGITSYDFTRDPQQAVEQPGGSAVPAGKWLSVSMTWDSDVPEKERFWGDPNQFVIGFASTNYKLDSGSSLRYQGNLNVAEICKKRDTGYDEAFRFLDCFPTKNGLVLFALEQGMSGDSVVAIGDINWSGYDTITAWIATDELHASNSPDTKAAVAAVKELLDSLRLK